MNRKPTLSDVARAAGVARATVGFVLSGRDDIAISEPTRERIKAAARDLGYRPNAVARALASGRTNAVMVIVPRPMSLYYARVLQVFERFINQQGYHMVASTVAWMDSGETNTDCVSLLNIPCDAILLVDVLTSLEGHLSDLRQARKPVISIGGDVVAGLDCIGSGLGNAACDAVTHLLASNPKRLAYAGASPRGLVPESIDALLRGEGEARLSAYCRTMFQARRPLEFITGPLYQVDHTIETLSVYIAENGCPDAIFCFNDAVALNVHLALRRLGLRLPADVLIVGCDNNDTDLYVDPELSSIAIPVDEMCRLAWEVIEERLARPEGTRRHTWLEPYLIVRGSSVRSNVCSA